MNEAARAFMDYYAPGRNFKTKLSLLSLATRIEHGSLTPDPSMSEQSFLVREHMSSILFGATMVPIIELDSILLLVYSTLHKEYYLTSFNHQKKLLTCQATRLWPNDFFFLSLIVPNPGQQVRRGLRGLHMFCFPFVK